MSLANLLRSIADAIDKPPQLDIKIYKIGGDKIGQKLTDMGIDHPFGVLDGEYFATDLEGWKTLLPHVLQDGYTATLKDCENMALLAMMDSSVKFGVNGIGMAVGTVPGGHHAFCIIYVHDLDKFMLFEPNRNGVKEPFDIGENNYTLQKVFI